MENAPVQFAFARPLWLLALAVVPLLIYYWRRSLVHFPRWQQVLSLGVRTLLAVLFVVALCGLRATGQRRQKHVVLAVDVSRSIDDKAARTARTFLEQVYAQAGETPVTLLPFAAEPGQPVDTPGDLPEADGLATDLESAIAAARAVVPATHVPEIVLLSDGNSTTGDALAAARSAGVPVSTVSLSGCPRHEVYVAAVETPEPVREGEPFYVEVVVQSTVACEGTVHLRADSQPVAEQRVRLRAGENRVRLRHSVVGRPLVTLTAELQGFPDTIAENNVAAAVVFLARRPRVLLVDSRPELAEILAAALENEDLEVVRRGPDELPDRPLESLLEHELLILSNVPAASLSAAWIGAIQQYVRDYGGGLIVVGGDRAFTPGGYAGTALDEILPVWCHVKKDKRKPSLAMVLVLDSSVSMQGNSIELAKQAARRAVDNLGPGDQVGIIAFEDRARWISEIHPCSDKQHVLKRIDTITAGGRTNMYPAVEKAYLALRDAFARLKHMIVLTDGLSDPDDFQSLAAQIAAAGITISTVAVGDEAAPELLEDVARIGGGNFYACEDPAAVPRIFALETISAGKVGITEEAFRPRLVHRDRLLAGLDFDLVPTLLGFAETRAKPTSRVILSSPDGDPLLAWWRYGQGVSAAFTSDIYQDRWASAWLRWPGFPRFWAQLVRHAARRQKDRNFNLHVHRRPAGARVVLDAVDPEGRFLNGARVNLQLVEPGGAPTQIAFEQVAPGRYLARFATPESGSYYLETRLSYRGPEQRVQGETVYVAHRGLVTGYPDELRVRPTNHRLLRSIAEATGGRFDPQPSDLFAPPGTSIPHTTRLWHYLLAAAAILFVVDVALKRIDFTRPTPAEDFQEAT